MRGKEDMVLLYPMDTDTLEERCMVRETKIPLSCQR